MEATVYNKDGKSAGKVTLPESIFGLPKNDDLVHQVVTAFEANARQGSAHSKDRSEVRGGGKKPWKQKGTGRARHGSRRSPIWVGGGVTFGPRNERVFEQKINKKMKVKALFTALSEKFRNGQVIFVENLEFSKPTTKEAQGMITALSKDFENLTKKRRAAFVAFDEADEKAYKSFRNLETVVTDTVANMNAKDVVDNAYVIIENPDKALEVLTKRI